MKEMRRIIALVLFLVTVISIMPFSAFSAENPVIDAAIFCSDVHRGTGSVTSIFQGIKKADSTFTPSTASFVGDTQCAASSVTSAAQGVFSGMACIYAFGNHDNEGDFGIEDYTGLCYGDDSTNYYIYTISESSMGISNPNTSGFTSTVAGLDHTKPLFILTHLPLHARRGDSDGAPVWYEAISAAAESMDIAVFWGHNHTGDNAVDQAAYYVEKDSGETINIEYGDENVALNFTYLNAGYIAPPNRAARQNVATAVRIYADSINFTVYNANGELTGSHAVNKTVNREFAAPYVEDTNTGACGENVSWTLDPNGLLTVSGTGAMYDYAWPENASPFDSCAEITSVIIENGITRIGDQAFIDCGNLTDVTIPDSVTSIGASAFKGCSSLASIVIPTSVQDIGSNAFALCENINEITFTGNAPSIGEDCFYSVTATVYYPESNKTWTDSVMQNYGGTITWIPYETASAVFNGMSLSLNGNISVNFYVELAEELLTDKNLRMVFQVGDTTQEMALANALLSIREDGSVWYRFSCSLPAKGMADAIIAQLYSTDGAIGESKTYSVAQYYTDICNQFSREEKPELFAMVEAMLNYGAAAQEYFGYNTDNLANAEISTAIPETVDASAYAVVVSDSDKQLSYAGMSLVLESNTTLRVFFRSVSGADISDYTFTANGQTVTPVQRGNLWYIELANIAAKDLDTAYTFTSGDVTVECSALSYVHNVLQKADALDEKLVSLCKALFAYSQTADAYFAAKN